MVAAQPAVSSTRLDFIDNLRSMTIIFVVTMHAAVTYSNFGRWYVLEPAPTGRLTLLSFGMYQSFLQAWFMGFLFLLAGYFVPASFDRKGSARFIADRAFRLGIPTLIYVLCVQPFIVWILMPAFRGTPLDKFGTHWLHYITSFSFLEGTGPMWFAVALLIFSLAYAAFRMASRRRSAPPMPSDLSIVMLILAISLCTFLMRTMQPLGTAVLNMQLGYFSQYIILFLVGILARRGDWLMRIPYAFGMRWFRISWLVGVPLWLAVVIGGGALAGADLALFNGGWHWQSAAISFWESLVCVGTCVGLVVLFRERFNTRGTAARFLSDNAFAVYVFHPPVLIAITMALHGMEVSAVVCFLVASILAIAASFLASHFIFRRIPLLKNAL